LTNGVGGVNGAAATGATLPRGRICGVAGSAAAATAFLARGFLGVVEVVMPYHGRTAGEKQANYADSSVGLRNNRRVATNRSALIDMRIATFLSLAGVVVCGA
jgi:hypothetical protein